MVAPKSVRKLELRAKRVSLAAESTERYGEVVREPAGVARIARGVLADEAHEVVIAILLDTRNRVIGYSEVGRGGIASCAVDIGAAFRAALIAGASGVIFAHNHPSSDETPSAEDDALTVRLVQAGALLDCTVLDHVVIGDGTFSYRSQRPSMFVTEGR